MIYSVPSDTNNTVQVALCVNSDAKCRSEYGDFVSIDRDIEAAAHPSLCCFWQSTEYHVLYDKVLVILGRTSKRLSVDQYLAGSYLVEYV